MTPPSRLRTSLLAGTLAAATAVAPVPASALDEDALRIIAGLVALGVVAKVIDDRNDRRRDEEREEKARSRDSHAGWSDGPSPVVEPDRHRRGRLLPASCLRDVVISRDGVRRVVEADCLSRRGVRAALPSSCATRVHAGGRERRAYGTRCLRRAGYVFR